MRRAAVMLPAALGLAVASAPARPGRTRTAPAAPACRRPARALPGQFLASSTRGIIALLAWLPGALSFAGRSMILRRSRQLDPRLFQIASLGTLLAANIAWFDIGARPGQSVVMLLAQAGFCRLFAVPLDWRSPLVTGLSPSLLLRTNLPPLWVAAPVLAIGSKFLLRVRGKHVFNPAAFAIAVRGAPLAAVARRHGATPDQRPRISPGVAPAPAQAGTPPCAASPPSSCLPPSASPPPAPSPRRSRTRTAPAAPTRSGTSASAARPGVSPSPKRERVHPRPVVSCPFAWSGQRQARVPAIPPCPSHHAHPSALILLRSSFYARPSMRCAAAGFFIPRPPRGSVPRAWPHTATHPPHAPAVPSLRRSGGGRPRRRC